MFDHSNLSLAEKTVLLMQDILKWRSGIEKALAHGEGSHTFDDVVARVMRGELHFFTFDGCCLFMQVVQYPQFKNYHCFVAVGDQESLDAAGVHMQNLAREYGCKYLSISGRVGWERRLRTRGWVHVLSTLYKEV